MVGNFWKDDQVESAKRQAAQAKGMTYVDLSDMWGVDMYQAGIGTMVQDESGRLYAIDHKGVAAHPGDKGMDEMGKRIAAAILQ